ncbi:MAG: hypothetical protein IIB63_10340 [Proteobacteria bacterium]|nr:hypothetical protein [Pseudomonadota bacterium]
MERTISSAERAEGAVYFLVLDEDGKDAKRRAWLEEQAHAGLNALKNRK